MEVKCSFCGHAPKPDDEVNLLGEVPGDWSGAVLAKDLSAGDTWRCPDCQRENRC